jgi:hypothetical protein
MAEAKSKTAAQKADPAAPKKSKASTAEKPAKPAPAKSATAQPAAKQAAKPAAVKKAAAPKAAAGKSTPKLQPGPEELYRMIQTAAYFIAERNGFEGDSKHFWAQAEAQILSILK